MKTRKWNTVNFPDYALCYHEYGDLDGVSAEDIANCEDWINGLKKAVSDDYGRPLQFRLVFGEDSFFSNTPCFGLPCNCTQAEILITY